MIAVSASAQISVGPSVVDLGTVQVGFADTAPLTVVNTGGGIVSVTDITSDDPQFTVSPTEFTLAAGANRVVTVTFTPTFVGLETATLTVSDDGGGSTSAGASGIGSMVIIPRTGDLLNDTKIAFESDLDGDWDIYTMLPDGSAVTPLTVNADLDIHPAWSPDGTRIAFISDRDGGGATNYELYVMNADGSGQTRLTTNSALEEWPTWSPDSQKIAFTSDRDGDRNIYAMRAEPGAAQLLLTANTATDDTPAWSPDGTRIVFSSTRDGIGRDLWMMFADGSGPAQWTFDNNEYGPYWSPDGTEIAYTVNTGLSIVDATTAGALRQGSTDAGDAEGGPWSPDGVYLTYYRLFNGGYDVFRKSEPVSFGATEVVVSSTNTISERHPSWSPFLSQFPPIVAITSPTDAQEFEAGTTSIPLTVDIQNHIAPGHWHWRLNTAFPATGVAEGTHLPAGTPTSSIPGLGDGETHTVYVALVDGSDNLLDFGSYPSARDSVVFSVAAAPVGIAVAPLAVDLVDVEVGTSDTATFTITSTGTATLTISDIASDDAAFTIAPNTKTLPFDLASGASETVTVTFTPTVEGAQTANITITHNAAGGSTVVTATGTATAPTMTLSILSPTADQVLPPDATHFTLRVDISGHPSPGHWHWQLDTPLPASGAAGGQHVDPGVTTASMSGLTEGVSYTAYVTLVDENDEVLATPVDANVAFSVNVIATDYVQVVSKQGGAGTVVRIPILIYDVTAVAVTGIDLDLLYDETVLTPTTDAGTGNLNAVSATDGVVPAGWTVEQNLPSLGRLAISLAGDFSAPILTGGLLVNVDFTISASATADTTLPTPIQITNLRLNEGGVPATGVDGLFTILGIVYGDVTGDGTISAYDGSWVLEYVVNNLTGTIKQFPIEIDPPVWASQPLTAEEAREVADVGNDSLDAQATPDDILASDASLILQRRVGIILLFPVEVAVAPVPVADPVSLAYTLSGSATSERPGARITVSLDTSAIEGLTAGEFALDFDPSLLRLTTVGLRARGVNQPLRVQSERDGRFAIAFASARLIESDDALLEVTFEASRAISQPTEGRIRATHLRLNRALIDTGFVYRYRVEPYQNRLMANYPNPFNPETWIPFELAADADVTIRIYDLAGGRIRTLELGALATGEYVGRQRAAYWDGKNAQGERVASGVYVYELAAGEYHSLRRMVVMK